MGRENRAILLTLPGPAAIAVIRLIGPGVAPFLREHFSRPTAPGRCTHGNLIDGARVIDAAVGVLSTESGFADVNVHGGAWVVKSTFDLARRCGFDVVEALSGPRPLDAVEGDSEIQREVMAWLPLARTELTVRALLAQPRAWREVESRMSADPEFARQQSHIMLSDRTLEHLLNPQPVAIVGAANVGKSTLANRLFAQERSITGDLPGTTRDWVGEIANIDGLPVMLLDTPGLRPTADLIERVAIEQSAEQIAQAQRIILVLDASRPLEPEQEPLLHEFAGAIRVINKCDRDLAWQLASEPAIRTIATTGQGVEELRRALFRSFLGVETVSLDVPRQWTARQRSVLAIAASVSENPGAS